MIRARVCDPAGPRDWRIAASVGLVPLAVIAFFAPLSADTRVIAMLMGLSWLTLGRIVVPRLRSRGCVVECEADAIVLKGAGFASQRIQAGHVKAASTSMLGGRVGLAIVRGTVGDCPLWLELENLADLERVRGALGVDHAGFGELVWPPYAGSFHVGAGRADVFASFFWIVALVAACCSSAPIAIAFGFFAACITPFAMLVAGSRRLNRIRIALTGAGIVSSFQSDRALIPWETILDAKDEQGTLVLQTTRGRMDGMSLADARPEERRHLVAQILSAAGRARGEGGTAATPPASLAVLARRDEPVRSWLGRLDAIAATLARSEGYREIGVTLRDLWWALEDPDAPVALRSAAARVLARAAPEQAKTRIAQAVCRQHDERARERIRVALEEDVDVAAHELDALDRVTTSVAPE